MDHMDNLKTDMIKKNKSNKTQQNCVHILCGIQEVPHGRNP